MKKFSSPSFEISRLAAQFCSRITCQSLCNTPKCNYSTCTNNPASASLILPPKLWQHYGAHWRTGGVLSANHYSSTPEAKWAAVAQAPKRADSASLYRVVFRSCFFLFLAWRQHQMPGSFLSQLLPIFVRHYLYIWEGCFLFVSADVFYSKRQACRNSTQQHLHLIQQFFLQRRI